MALRPLLILYKIFAGKRGDSIFFDKKIGFKYKSEVNKEKGFYKTSDA
jgi:hypothetical protein